MVFLTSIYTLCLIRVCRTNTDADLMFQEGQTSDSPGWAAGPAKRAALHSDEPPSSLFLCRSCTPVHRSRHKRQNKALKCWLTNRRNRYKFDCKHTLRSGCLKKTTVLFWCPSSSLVTWKNIERYSFHLKELRYNIVDVCIAIWSSL